MIVLGIDHLVVAAPDPDAAAAELEKRCGLRATGGGRHEALGTFNRLVWFGDSYLELIGIFDHERAGASWIGRPTLDGLARGGGLVTWAVAVEGMQEAVRDVRGRGGAIGDPLPGERRRPDGAVVRWRLALPGALGPDRAPFLIEHDSTAAEWTAAVRRARGRFAHPAGGPVGLASLELSVPDPRSLAGEISTLTGSDAIPMDDAVQVPIGDQFVRLARGRSLPIVRLAIHAPIEARQVDLAGCVFDLRSVPGAGPPRR